MQLLNGPSRIESCNLLEKGRRDISALPRNYYLMNQSKMLALKPEGSQHTLSSCRALLTAVVDLVEPWRHPLTLCFSATAFLHPRLNRPITMFIRPPSWQIKTNDHEGESLPQPEP